MCTPDLIRVLSSVILSVYITDIINHLVHRADTYTPHTTPITIKSLQPTPKLNKTEHEFDQQSKKARHHSPTLTTTTQPHIPDHPTGEASIIMSTIQPSDEWIGSTHEDMQEQMDEYNIRLSISTARYKGDNHENPMDIFEQPATKQPLFTLPQQACQS